MSGEKTGFDVIFKAIAVVLAVASIVLGTFKLVKVETNVFLLGLGLFALAVSAWDKGKGGSA